MSKNQSIHFQNTYSDLPNEFYAPVTPRKVFAPQLISFNQELATELGLPLSNKTDSELADLFTGQVIPASAHPIALAYAGHQFGHFVPQLGDGRALLMGEVVSTQGQRFDIQLKGSGTTPFSRGGDGLSPLGPVIREYIVSEAMHHLGVPTTRALAAVSTGESVHRDESLPGGVFTRVASSHIRIGTFQYFAARNNVEALKTLLSYSINRHYPEIKDDDEKALGFLKSVAQSQAKLVAQWMSFGFIHGVMNTDNMSISGETIDYGPCAFMDHFSFKKVFSSIDRGGRYAYNNQIQIAKWNLARLAECFIPLVDSDQERSIEKINACLTEVDSLYEKKWLEQMVKKMGLFEAQTEDEALINKFLNLLETENLDFTLSFRGLIDTENFLSSTALCKEFYQDWKIRLEQQSQTLNQSIDLMKSVNPAFIPRNHWVEKAIQLAYKGDYSVFKEMNTFLKKPFSEQSQFVNYQNAPTKEERVHRTFCGT